MPYSQDRAVGLTDTDLIFEQMDLREMLPVGSASAFCFGDGAEDRRHHLAGLFDDVLVASGVPDRGPFDFVSAAVPFDLEAIGRLLQLLRPGGSIALLLLNPGALHGTWLRRAERIVAVMERNGVVRHATPRTGIVIGRKWLRREADGRPTLRVVSSR